MKKILCLLACLFVFGVTASAATLTVDYRYSTEDNGFIVYGTSTDTMIGDEVTVEAYLTETAGGAVRLLDVQTTLTYLDDTQVKYETEAIPVDYTIPSGTISFTAYSAHTETSVQTTTPYQYYGISDAYAILKDLSQYLRQNNYDSFVSTVKNPANAAILGVDLSRIPANTSAAYAATTGYLSTMTITVPSVLSSEQDYKDTYEKLAKFRADCENMLMVSDFALCSNSTDFVNWYSTYSNKLKLSEISAQKLAYFNSKYTNAKYFEILASESMIIYDISALKTRILDVAGLTAVAQGNSSVVSDVTIAFSDRMIGKNSVDAAVHTVVCDELDGNTYSSFANFVIAYNGAIPQTPSGGNESGGSVGGGGGGGASIGMNSAPVQPVVKQVFSDMAKDHWARPAVEYLYDLGIINGRTDSEFAPDENITRAEFIKILVCVKNVNLVYEKSEFSDVAEDAWYAPYVNSAYVNNITSGYDDGTFKPNQKITREDMATMIFRMAGYQDTEETPSFNDAESISSYAKSAVAVLNKMGIVNGMDANNFAPKNSATRAQAAQIIYNYLVK